MEGLLNQLILDHVQLAPLQWGEYHVSPVGDRAAFSCCAGTLSAVCAAVIVETCGERRPPRCRSAPWLSTTSGWACVLQVFLGPE